MNELVRYERHDSFAEVVMDDGRANVMSPAMLEALHTAVDRAARDDVMLILRSARPGVFSAGFDMKLLASGDLARSVDMVRAGGELAMKLLAFQAPVISVCAGHAYPMGAFLLLASDLRIGALGDYRIGLNEVSVGITVPAFALELARSRLHPAWLNRTVLTGEMFGPEDARTAGFVDRLVAPDALDAALSEATKELQRVHRPSHVAVKHRLRSALLCTMRAVLDAEVAAALRGVALQV
jgi:enoyl-CoA hydratase